VLSLKTDADLPDCSCSCCPSPHVCAEIEGVSKNHLGSDAVRLHFLLLMELDKQIWISAVLNLPVGLQNQSVPGLCELLCIASVNRSEATNQTFLRRNSTRTACDFGECEIHLCFITILITSTLATEISKRAFPACERILFDKSSNSRVSLRCSQGSLEMLPGGCFRDTTFVLLAST
jgi:hypothetical protein